MCGALGRFVRQKRSLWRKVWVGWRRRRMLRRLFPMPIWWSRQLSRTWRQNSDCSLHWIELLRGLYDDAVCHMNCAFNTHKRLFWSKNVKSFPSHLTHRVALISDFEFLTLGRVPAEAVRPWTWGHWASASHGVPVYFPTFACLVTEAVCVNTLRKVALDRIAAGTGPAFSSCKSQRPNHYATKAHSEKNKNNWYFIISFYSFLCKSFWLALVIKT